MPQPDDGAGAPIGDDGAAPQFVATATGAVGAAAGTTATGGCAAMPWTSGAMSGSVSRRTVRCALAAAARGSRRRTRGATVTGIIGASPVETTGVIVGDAALGSLPIISGATATGCAAGTLASATAWPPVRRPELCCDALPETDRKPVLVDTDHEKLNESASPLIDPEPARRTKFMRMSRTESVNVQRCPAAREMPASPLRFASNVHRSPRSLVTRIVRSEREPGVISRRSRVERSSVVEIGDVTDTVVFDDTAKEPENGPGPRDCADAAAAAKNDAAPTLITNALLRLIVCMVR